VSLLKLLLLLKIKLLQLLKKKSPLQKQVEDIMLELSFAFNESKTAGKFTLRLSELEQQLLSLPAKARDYIKPYTDHYSKWVVLITGSVLCKQYDEDIFPLLTNVILKQNADTQPWYTDLLVKTDDKRALEFCINNYDIFNSDSRNNCIEGLLKKKIKNSEYIALNFIQQENDRVGILNAVQLLALSSKLSAVVDLWSSFDTDKKNSILSGILLAEENNDKDGRLSILDCALKDEETDIVKEALNILELEDLQVNKLKPALESLHDHPELRIKNKAVRYTDVIDQYNTLN